jgi:hypothetical protein
VISEFDLERKFVFERLTFELGAIWARFLSIPSDRWVPVAGRISTETSDFAGKPSGEPNNLEEKNPPPRKGAG